MLYYRYREDHWSGAWMKGWGSISSDSRSRPQDVNYRHSKKETQKVSEFDSGKAT